MERPCLITLWMQFQRARRALGSMPVVGSSCNEQHSQVQVGPQVEQEAEAEGEEQRQQGHHGSPPNCPSTPACLCFCTQSTTAAALSNPPLPNPSNPVKPLSDWLVGGGLCNTLKLQRDSAGSWCVFSAAQ